MTAIDKWDKPNDDQQRSRRMRCQAKVNGFAMGCLECSRLSDTMIVLYTAYKYIGNISIGIVCSQEKGRRRQ
jgi:hypothetical protein